ncbi:MAG: hypothetical protein Q7S33_02270 [Nanoarchaeota archaeon]|nr:hypothetical protein [Nanoarchaeota archaeon]
MNEPTKCSGKYSVWIMPEKKIYDKFSNLIYQLSQKYDFPFFEPHITLIGKLSGEKKDLIEKTSRLTSSVNLETIKLNYIDRVFDDYFRSVFIRAQKTINILDVNIKAKEIFNQGDPKRYFPFYQPHLSLAYGNFSPKIKERIVSDILKEFNITSKTDFNLDLKFEADKICLYSTEGKVENWYNSGGFSLK